MFNIKTNNKKGGYKISAFFIYPVTRDLYGSWSSFSFEFKSLCRDVANF